MNSMTGFGRAEIEENGMKMAVELKSVNHRFLDMNIRMPRFMLFLEDYMRRLIKESVARGRVDVFLNYTATEESGKTVKVDTGLLKGYMAAAREIENATGIQNDLSMAEVMRLSDVLIFEDQEKDEDALKSLMERTAREALRGLTEARKREGERICADLIDRIGALRRIASAIEKREPSVVEEYRKKLHDRLAEELDETEIDINRFNSEILYFADKMSITEELVRLKSHCSALEELLAGSSANGRSLDFIVQELNREFNTIGSKSADVKITKLVIDGKSEVEKIREQVQNIE